jgi:hypothetical protein
VSLSNAINAVLPDLTNDLNYPKYLNMSVQRVRDHRTEPACIVPPVSSALAHAGTGAHPHLHRDCGQQPRGSPRQYRIGWPIDCLIARLVALSITSSWYPTRHASLQNIVDEIAADPALASAQWWSIGKELVRRCCLVGTPRVPVEVPDSRCPAANMIAGGARRMGRRSSREATPRSSTPWSRRSRRRA